MYYSTVNLRYMRSKFGKIIIKLIYGGIDSSRGLEQSLNYPHGSSICGARSTCAKSRSVSDVSANMLNLKCAQFGHDRGLYYGFLTQGIDSRGLFYAQKLAF